MNKGLFLSLAATALLASCSSDEVLESVEPQTPQVISFENPFVDKGTRAVNDILTEGLTNFYVFASYTDQDGTNAKKVYANEPVTKGNEAWNPTEPQYWVAEKNYKFVAYSDGNTQLDNKNLTYANETGAIGISNYVVNTKDLILSGMVEQKNSSAAHSDPIALTFKHLLSKVKFSIKSEFGSTTKLFVSGLKFTAVNKGNYATKKWTNVGSTKVEHTYPDITVQGGKTVTSAENYVLPQDNSGIEATFTVTLKDQNDVVLSTKTFEKVALTTAQTVWNPGFVYNYTATINTKNISLQAQLIKFSVSVDTWTNAADTNALPGNK